MRLGAVVVAFLVAATAAHADPVVVDVPAILAKGKAEVTKTLGKPQACAKVKQGEKCQWRDGALEVVFIGGAADWLTITADIPYGADGLPALGFKPAKPTFSNQFVARWSNGLEPLAQDGKGATMVVFLQTMEMQPGAPGRAAMTLVKGTTP